jgi:hypothetical protein
MGTTFQGTQISTQFFHTKLSELATIYGILPMDSLLLNLTVKKNSLNIYLMKFSKTKTTAREIKILIKVRISS